MKFPKSMHADGWANHFDDAPAAPVRTSPKPGLKTGFKAGAKPVNAHTPLHGDPLPYNRTASVTTPVSPAAYSHAAAAPTVRPAASTSASSSAPRSNTTPWVIGVGVGALLIGGAVVMSRSMKPSEPAAAIVVGQATPSPEDVQLQTAPPSTGVVTAAPEATPTPAETPAVKAADEAPAVKPADEAPAVKPAPAETRTAKASVPTPPVTVAAAPAPKVQAPEPVVRTLTPQPEVLAQASPPPVLRDILPMPAATPATPAVVPPEATTAPVVPPVATAPVTPPLAQQAPAAPDPVDTGITVQVRQALAADAVLSTARIAVTTDHGVVKLEGQAPDIQARERATVVAAATTGVKAVDNRLTLPPMAALDKTLSNGG